MKKREQGILTVEASIVLTFFTLFVLFLFSFVRIYRAENMVSHATLQAADAVALESYLRETALDEQAEDVVYLASRLTGSETLSADSFKSLRFTDILPSIAKEKFVAAVANSESNADKILTNLGVKDGLSGIDFSASKMDLDHDDVIVSVSYTLKMQFPILGANELSLTKSAKAKTFGEILFEITTKSNDEMMGSATGGGNYQHGKTIQISAIPNSGYRFVKWDDGDTSNPRTVTVTEAHTYIAIFEVAGYGVTVKTHPENGEYGSAEVSNGTTVIIPGGGTGYEKGSSITVSAYPNTGYHFDHWIITQNNTGIAERNEEVNATFTVDQSYTCTAYFMPNEYNAQAISNIEGVEINLKTPSSSPSTEVKVLYGEKLRLFAGVAPTGYIFDGWYTDGETNKLSGNQIHYLESFNFDHDVTFVAKYTRIQYTVNVESNGNGSVSGGGTYYYGDYATISANPNDGYEFDYWTLNGLKTSLPANAGVTVNASANYKAYFKKITVTITLNPMGGSIDGITGTQSYQIDYNGNSRSLPKPFYQGYVFIGWKCNGVSYNAGSTAANVIDNMTFVAQWVQCHEHEWGRCGETHTATHACYIYLNGIKHSIHKTKNFQCRVCIKCGAFDNGKCTCTNMNKELDRTKISKVHLCYDGICGSGSNTYKGWDQKYRNPEKVYNIHKEIGYP